LPPYILCYSPKIMKTKEMGSEPNAFFRATLLALVFTQFLTVAMAQSPVHLTINAQEPQIPIPSDFSGFSFETGSLRYNHYRPHEYFFDSSNTNLLMLFKNLGIKSLRIGGNSVDRGYIPSTNDIDAFFRFAKAADVKVIFSLRLANGDALQDASIAKYVWNSYRTNLISLAIGNEANSYNGLDPEMTNSSLFIAKWNRFASKVTAAVPDVILGSPDNGNGAISWATAFAKAEQGRNNVTCVFAHYEPGGTGREKSPQQIIKEMLSPVCDTVKYPKCYEALGVMAHSHGLAYRFTEANTHVAPISTEIGNHSFATALFALDFMHWWAAHDCSSINFHTGAAGFNAALDFSPDGHYVPYPICYGIAAFGAGGQGDADSMTIKNPDRLNLTAYAVTDTNNNLFVTVVNKENGKSGRSGTVTINAVGASASVMYLSAPEITDTSGVTLGGAMINDAAPWTGQWSLLASTNADGCEIKVAASSAAIVKVTGARIVTQ
jgi:hypothetical protein